MSFISNDSVLTTSQIRTLIKRLIKSWERLQGHRDDPCLGGQSVSKLLRLTATGILSDWFHYPGFMLELIDGVPELPVQDSPVSHHNHRIKHPLVMRVVQGCKLVCCPGYRVALA